jgi:ATP-dependent DNA helicase DinG
MAEAVERTLDEGRILLCEAGTGTGKTLAYLVPALLGDKKVVVSTATRALQEQIAFKDVPLIGRALGVEPSVAVMKGLSNYVCLRRFHEFSKTDDGTNGAAELVQEWVSETETGDLVELSGLAEDHPVRARIGSSSDTRIGSSCEYYERCFVTRMRQEAERARLVIVNHHLFFADLALRGPHPGRVLPDYDAVVFDEAHQLEDIATEFFGVRVSRGKVDRFVEDTRRAVALRRGRTGSGTASSGEVVLQQLLAENVRFWSCLGRSLGDAEGRVNVERDVFTGEVARAWHALDTALEAVGALAATEAARPASGAAGSPAGREALELAERRARTLRDTLATIVEGGPGRVTWLEQGSGQAVLSSSPVDVSEMLRERVFERVGSVVMTSATLSDLDQGALDADAGSSFGYVRSRLGLDRADFVVDELRIESPFDFAQNTLFYVPEDLPEPNDPSFLDKAAGRIVELVELTHGGAFVLTTSLRSMRALHRLLSPRLHGRRSFVQGQAPKPALLSAFRADGRAVLVATMGFWEGVDIAGSALRLVVLEKVPFAVPSDPLLQARAARVEAEGKSPFAELSVPAAAIALKQGFGRLVRSAEDTGIVALLDRRVLRRGYGARLLGALPASRRAHHMSDVCAFAARVWGAAPRS